MSAAAQPLSTTAIAPRKPEFIIIGSGVSTAIPRISCIIRPNDDPVPCPTCHDAVHNPSGPNRRSNVSALVRHSGKTVLIDCGKTIREAAVRYFPTFGVQNIDAIVLTHGHADAMLGLDDSRDFQGKGKLTEVDGQPVYEPASPTPVFLNEETLAVCKNAFPYLMPKEEKKTNEKKDISRRVAALQWNPYPEEQYFVPFQPLKGVPIEFTPFPMYHGGTYICMGFLIKLRDVTSDGEIVIAYLSDVHVLPETSMAYLQSIPHIDVMVVDMLTRSLKNRSHYNINESIDLVRALRPDKAVAVGMTCSLGLHDDVNKELAQLDVEGLNFRLAHDGMHFEF